MITDNTNYFDSSAVSAVSPSLVHPLQARKKDNIINMIAPKIETIYEDIIRYTGNR